MAQRLELNQKQILSQNLIQMMEVLQMSVQELEAYLQELSLENPVIELEDRPAEAESAREMARARKLEWLESTDHQNKVYYREGDREEDRYLQHAACSGETLAEYLLSQIMTFSYTQKEREIVAFLIYSLDARGYFTDDMSAVAASFSVPEEEIQRLLREVQALDPAGVGARSLQECLLLQMERLPEHTALAETIVRDHLPDVGRHHLQIIARKLGVPVAEVEDACKEICALNPKPGNAFSDRTQLHYISPDAVVVRVEDGFEILVNEYQYPRFRISEYYTELEKTVADKETKKYLREKIQQARTVAGNVKQRTSTLSKVLHVLVEKQQDFFLYGAGHRRPLKLSDIAKATELHESTISRTLRSKYLQCSWGVYPLNYFLCSVASTNAVSGEDQTPEYIKAQLKKIIQEEDRKKPLSDAAIAKCLKAMHISISRRTVNKYRQELGIPDKGGRKFL